MTFIKSMLLWLSVCPLFFKRKKHYPTSEVDLEPIDWTPVLARLKSNASYAVDPRLLDDTDLDDFSMSRGGTD
jgi:hypothetical protein